MPAVSIVLRARDEAAALPEVFRALASQSLRDAEWIVVDDGSADGTAEISRGAGARVISYCSQPIQAHQPSEWHSRDSFVGRRESPAHQPLEWHSRDSFVGRRESPAHQPSEWHSRDASGRRFSYGGALNAGFAAARAPLVVALSAHAIPASPCWLESLLAPLAVDDVAAVFGPEWPRPDADAVVRHGLRRRYAGLTAHDLAPRSRLTFGNTNAGVRRAAWERLPFDESLPYAEDLEWSLRAMAAGWRVVFTPDAPVYHSHRDDPPRAYQRAYLEGVAARRIGWPLRHHRTAGLCAALTASALLDAAMLAAARAHPREWWRVLGCRWARSLGGWRGYRAGGPS